MIVHEDKCRDFGLDVRRVRSIARRLSTAAREAQAIGLTIFGGSGSGVLRMPGGAQNNVADLDGSYDGGDGGDEY